MGSQFGGFGSYATVRQNKRYAYSAYDSIMTTASGESLNIDRYGNEDVVLVSRGCPITVIFTYVKSRFPFPTITCSP